jgi:autotransporter-associated beta strand protein
MKKVTPNSLRFIPAALCLLFSLLANNATANYFHVNGTATDYGIVANNSYSWDGPVIWATAATAAPTVTWVAGDFARFNSTTTPYTVNVNGTVSMTGMFGASGVTLTVNAVGGGNLNVPPNGTLTAGLPVQGFFTGGGTLLINVPITGTGGVAENSGGGNLELLGHNTYSGGTVFNSSSTLTYFKFNDSFGTGPICLNGTSFAPILGTGGATITLANNWTNIGNCGVNFAAGASTPVVLTGPWTMTGTLNLRNNGDTTAPLTLSGPISGAFALTMSANNAGTITLSGASTYSGRTIISAGANVAGVGMTVSVGSINSVSGGSASSNLGAPTTGNGTIGIGLTTFTSTLIYTGAGETSDRAIDLSGTTGGAIIEMDGAGPLVFTSTFTVTGVGAKTLTLQGTSVALNSIAKIVDSSSGATAVVKAQSGTWVITGANTYSGGTTISAGTLEVSGSIQGSVTLSGTAMLKLDNQTALTAATLTLPATPVAGSVSLNFTGTQVISALKFGSTTEPTGTYGSLTSSATTKSATFTGNGILAVTSAPLIVTEPQPATVWPGGNTTFSVVAVGPGTLTYQWSLNGTSLGSSATASSYTVTGATSLNAGNYTSVIANGNLPNATTTGALLTVLTTNAYNSAVLADNPISYWRLDEASGTTAYDYVGGNNGTYHNVLLNQTPGYSVLDSDACIGLQAAPSYVSVANYQAFNFFTNPSPTFTLEGWVKFTSVAGVQRLFSTDQNVQPLGYMFGISGANQLVFTTSSYNDYFSPTLASPLQVNVWYQLAVGCDGSSLYFYVNGQPVGTVALAANPRGGTNGVPMCLGANGNFPGAYEQVQGKLDECAIYGTYIGGSELLAHYNATLPAVPVAQTPVADQPTNYVSLTTTFTENAVGTALLYQWTKVGSPTVLSTGSTLTLSSLALTDAGSYQVAVSNGGGSTNPPAAALTVLAIPATAAQVGLTNGMVLHLPFDTDYKDISGRNNNGTAVGATTVGVPVAGPAAVGGGALHYSSDTAPTYNYVTLGKPSDLQFGNNVDFTVAFWVRQAFADISTNLPFFASTVGSIGANLGFCFAPGLTSLSTPNGGWAWEIYDGTHQDYATGAPSSISDGNWHHLAFAFNRTANVTTYLDGQQVDSRSDAYLAASIDSGNNINIGQDATGTFVVPAASQADLDDLGVWRRALTQLEVSGMYLAGVSNSPGVSFAPVITAVTPTPTTISNILGTSLTYGGGAGSQFVLLSNNIVSAPLSTWTRVATNSSTPGSFVIPAVGSPSTTFYRVQSQ